MIWVKNGNLGKLNGEKIRAIYDKDKSLICSLKEKDRNTILAILAKDSSDLGAIWTPENQKNIDKNTDIKNRLDAINNDEGAEKADSSKENGYGIKDDDFKKMTSGEALEWLRTHETTYLSEKAKEILHDKVNNADVNDKDKENYNKKIDGKSFEDIADENEQDPPDPIYVSPNRKDDDEEEGKKQTDLDDILTSANEFVQGQDTSTEAIDDEVLQNLSSTFYNILFAIGVAATVIVGMIIGIKYMMGSTEEKADYKQMLLPYFIGCVVVYGAFGIWKIVIEIMKQI